MVEVGHPNPQFTRWLKRAATFAVAAASAAFLYSGAPQSALPEGEARDVTERVCSACHELVVVTSERHTEAQWKALVDDMVRRGAEASDAERQQILTYLVKNFGKK